MGTGLYLVRVDLFTSRVRFPLDQWFSLESDPGCVSACCSQLFEGAPFVDSGDAGGHAQCSTKPQADLAYAMAE